MATIEFTTHHAKRSESGGFQVIFHLDGTPSPFPSRRIEARRTDEALAAFETYKAEAAETGTPMVACMAVRAGRAPNGFKAATTDYYYPVNL